jgi:hypothetical protein
VRTGSRNLERAAGALLSADVGEVGLGRRVVRARGHDRIRLELAAQVRNRVREMPKADRLDTGERRFGRRLGRAEHAFKAHPARALGDGKHARDAPEPAVERELADGRMTVELLVRHLPRGGEHCKRDRQVIPGALLPQPGRRKVDRDAPAWKFELRGLDARFHTLPGLRTRTVGQADDDERGSAVALDVRLDLDAAGL